MASRIHHVCWCVEPDQVDPVKELLGSALGAELLDLDLDELGIRALISWEAGVEVIAPTRAQGRVAPTARAYLDAHGPGVYTVVFDVDELRPALEAAARFGVHQVFREELPVFGALAERYRALENVTLDPWGGLRLSLQQLLERDPVED